MYPEYILHGGPCFVKFKIICGVAFVRICIVYTNPLAKFGVLAAVPGKTETTGKIPYPFRKPDACLKTMAQTFRVWPRLRAAVIVYNCVRKSLICPCLCMARHVPRDACLKTMAQTLRVWPRLRAGRASVRRLLFIISYSKLACKKQIVKKRRFPIKIAKTALEAF